MKGCIHPHTHKVLWRYILVLEDNTEEARCMSCDLDRAKQELEEARSTPCGVCGELLCEDSQKHVTNAWLTLESERDRLREQLEEARVEIERLHDELDKQGDEINRATVVIGELECELEEARSREREAAELACDERLRCKSAESERDRLKAALETINILHRTASIEAARYVARQALTPQEDSNGVCEECGGSGYLEVEVWGGKEYGPPCPKGCQPQTPGDVIMGEENNMPADNCPFPESEDFENKECPPVDKLMEVPAIIEQLEGCDYQCEAGPLKLNVAFMRLKEIAEEYKEYRYVSWTPPRPTKDKDCEGE